MATHKPPSKSRSDGFKIEPGYMAPVFSCAGFFYAAKEKSGRGEDPFSLAITCPRIGNFPKSTHSNGQSPRICRAFCLSRSNWAFSSSKFANFLSGLKNSVK